MLASAGRWRDEARRVFGKVFGRKKHHLRSGGGGTDSDSDGAGARRVDRYERLAGEAVDDAEDESSDAARRSPERLRRSSEDVPLLERVARAVTSAIRTSAAFFDEDERADVSAGGSAPGEISDARTMTAGNTNATRASGGIAGERGLRGTGARRGGSRHHLRGGVRGVDPNATHAPLVDFAEEGRAGVSPRESDDEREGGGGAGRRPSNDLRTVSDGFAAPPGAAAPPVGVPLRTRPPERFERASRADSVAESARSERSSDFAPEYATYEDDYRADSDSGVSDGGASRRSAASARSMGITFFGSQARYAAAAAKAAERARRSPATRRERDGGASGGGGTAVFRDFREPPEEAPGTGAGEWIEEEL